MENTLVWCKTKAEVREVLSEAKNMGYHMTNLDDYTERFWSTHESETVINLHGNDKNLTYCYKDWYINHPGFGKIITASKFFGRKPILITGKGRVVTAENKNTGEKAIATCCPTDTFDFGTGAMIAVARLIAQSDKGITKDAETVLRQLLGYDAETPAEEEELINGEHKYVVGDRVRVKAWEVMKGTHNFVSTMRHLCGRTATITNVYYDNVNGGNHSYEIGLEFDDDSGDTRWQYQACMVEPLDESKPEMPTTKFKIGDLVTLREGVKEGDHFGHLDVEYGAMFSQGYHKPIKVIEISKAGSYLCVPAKGNGTDFYYHEEMLEPWDGNKIREGDKVHVKKGCTKDRYDTYYKWLKDYISDVDLLLGFERRESVSTADVYTVVKIGHHEYFTDCQLAFIKRTDGLGNTYSYLFDINGLEKVTEE